MVRDATRKENGGMGEGLAAVVLHSARAHGFR